jgi:hypothetical protein
VLLEQSLLSLQHHEYVACLHNVIVQQNVTDCVALCATYHRLNTQQIAEVLANVVNAMVVQLIDSAVATLKSRDDDETQISKV